jgi:hypothetical protein
MEKNYIRTHNSVGERSQHKQGALTHVYMPFNPVFDHYVNAR